MAMQLKDKHIAGATVSVVVDNKPFFAKGYGYADVKAKKPVDPQTSMFRVGSVSKLFTWTAIMRRRIGRCSPLCVHSILTSVPSSTS